MLTIQGLPQRLCSGYSRRDFLRVGGLGAFGLAWPNLLQAIEKAPRNAPPSFGRAKRCILLFLTGGPPQLDTWDMKPSAPERIRGELKPIATKVPGLFISELFPQLAQRAERLCVVRSVTHDDRTHTSAGYTMLTGVPHPLANAMDAKMVQPSPGDHPHLGALLAKARPSQSGAPTFAALPEIIKDANVNLFPGLDGGLLGNEYAPLQIEANAERTAIPLPEVLLPRGGKAERLRARQELLAQLDRGQPLARRPAARDMDHWYQKAFSVLQSAAVARAFDLAAESQETRDRYGTHLFGQGCLLARRLVEAGVALVTVYWHYEGPDDSPVWDTHENNFAHLRKRLMPPTDMAFAALLDDLAGRGLLDETLVICMGEFGRSPLVNNKAGRDHWAAAQSIALAGAGVPAGTVYGSTDREGGYPADKPVTPADLTASFMHLLGIPADFEIHNRAGRPFRACQGSPVRGILGG
jgi:hypothetical protein